MKTIEPEQDDPRYYAYLVWARWKTGWRWYGIDNYAQALAASALLQKECDEGPVFVTSGDAYLGLSVGKELSWTVRPITTQFTREPKTLLDVFRNHAEGGVTVHDMLQWFEIHTAYRQFSYDAAYAAIEAEMHVLTRNGSVARMNLKGGTTTVYYLPKEEP